MQSHGTVLQLTEWDIKTRLAKFPVCAMEVGPCQRDPGAASTDRFVNHAAAKEIILPGSFVLADVEADSRVA